jgi:hypothetical protein
MKKSINIEMREEIDILYEEAPRGEAKKTITPEEFHFYLS